MLWDEKVRRNWEIDQCFLVYGLFSILTWFILNFILIEPLIIIRSEVTYHESGSVYEITAISIWNVFLYIGCTALFIGFFLKFILMLKNPHRKMEIPAFLGLVLAGANIFFQIYILISIFENNAIQIITLLELIIFMMTICLSISYLIIDWLKGPVPPHSLNAHQFHK
jgi:hypothetical protein